MPGIAFVRVSPPPRPHFLPLIQSILGLQTREELLGGVEARETRPLSLPLFHNRLKPIHSQMPRLVGGFHADT